MPDLFLSPSGSVQLSQDLIRISRLPRRTWEPERIEYVRHELTDIFRTSVGQMKLKPAQAVALYETGTQGGSFCGMGVGLGKTLVSMLSPEATFAERPLLLIPAKLVDKTRRDFNDLRFHWRIRDYIRIMTYDWLGRAQAADAIEDFNPDLVIADEVQKLRQLDTAVTRRVRRFFSEHPEVKFVCMSGTITKRSLHDYAHLLRWVYAPNLDRMPLPEKWADLEAWADAIDNRKDQTTRADPGALKILCGAEEQELWKTEPRRAARLAYQRRLRETPGVIMTEESTCDATLTISSVEFSVNANVEEAFRKLRADWELPDDWTLMDGMQVHQHACQLALEFFYRWDPRPPRQWLDVRKNWSRFCREILKHSRKLDSELQVKRAYPNAPELLEWLEIKPTFEQNTVPVWLGDSVLSACAEWAERECGIIWTEHVVFAERLERDFGIKYYGKKGLSADGSFIDDHSKNQPLVASIRSSAEGRNLQAWSASLVTCWPANGPGAEQILGRTHRDGQQADEVQVDVVATCREHVSCFWQSVADANYALDSTGAPQKVLLAGKNFLTTSDLLQRSESRWALA